MANPIKRSDVHRGDARLDHQLSQKDALFFRFSVDWSDLIIPDTFDRNIGGNEASFAGDDDVKGRSMVGALDSHIHTRHDRRFRYGYTQFNMSLLPTTLSNPLWNTIPGRDRRTILISHRRRSWAPPVMRVSAMRDRRR